MAALPYLGTLASETQYDASYHNEGRWRQSEQFCLFKYTLRGEGVFRDADGEHRVAAGRGFLCQICDPATAYYYSDDGVDPWTFVYACFGGAGAVEVVHSLVRRFGPIYRLPAGGEIVQRMEGWRGYDGTHPQISPAEGAAFVWGLLAALAASKEELYEDDPANVLTLRAQRVVRENLHQNLNATELAGRLGVSREHLTRVFRMQTGRTPHRFIRRQKMLLACRLLKETTLSNKEISARLGYDAPAHFARTFKSVLRMTPRRFREVGTVPWH
jgi:AraC-like DNA-binding protein